MKSVGFKPVGRLILLLTLVLLMLMPTANAHFQTLIPDQSIVSDTEGANINIEMAFTHPMERGPLMNMGEPVRFGVRAPGGKSLLLDALRPSSDNGVTSYSAEYQLRQPGDHLFYVEPAPYWEPAEGKMIIHYTKVVVNAYGLEQGWDENLGLPVEIQPLTRPYGIWSGNIFRGVVLRDGVPVPGAEVEVEWLNDGSLQPSSSPFVTQVVQADTQGVFSYAIPRAGWWGFAALTEDDAPMANPAGELVPVEQGGLIWVHARDMR
jgi:cobalt/nickel transport protein